MCKKDYSISSFLTVLGHTFPANQLNRLQSVLHAAVRLIYGASRRDHVKPLLRRLHWLSVPECVEFKLCVLTYRCVHGLGPDYFSSEFTRVSDLRPRQRLCLASTAALIVRATRHCTLATDRAFPVIGARLWNSLPEPDDITTATSLLTFRHKLNTFLFR